MPEKLEKCVDEIEGKHSKSSKYAICNSSIKKSEGLLELKDPRGDGAVLDDQGQPNIIDYSNQEPLLFGLGQNSSHEYPGKIVINNESRYVDREVKKATIPGPSETGKYSVGADRTQPTLPTGAPYELIQPDHNMHGLNFNDKINWNEKKEVVSIPGTLVDKEVATKKELELKEAYWSEEDHPRAASGSATGGQFVSQGGDGEKAKQPEMSIPGSLDASRIENRSGEELSRMMIFWSDDRNIQQATPQEKADIQKFRDNIREKYKEKIAAGEVSKIQEEDFRTRFGLDKGLTPDPDDTPETGTKNPYENLPDNTDKPGEGRKMRQTFFANYEEDNGKLWQLKDDVRYQGKWLKEREEMLEKKKIDPDSRNESLESIQKNVDALRTEVDRKAKEATEIEARLNKAGKLEYIEVQRLLHDRQTYVDDLTRRKENSKKWMDDHAYIMAYDRKVDDYRTGKAKGHYEKEYAEKIRRETIERKTFEKKMEKERLEKKMKTDATFQTKLDEANAVLKKHGIQAYDANYANIEKLRPSDDLVDRAKTNIKSHQEMIQANQNFNEAEGARLQIMQRDRIKNYGTEDPGLKKSMVLHNWRAANEVSDHGVLGVHVYSDVARDSEKMKSHIAKLSSIPNVTKTMLQHVEIRGGAGEFFRMAGGRRARALGVWKSGDATAVMWNNNKKWDKAFGEKEAFGTTADHEYAHATYDSVETLIKNTPQEFDKAGKDIKTEIQTAFENFKEVADRTGNADYGDLGKFTTAPYTDSYHRTRDVRRHTETHSKLREWDVEKQLEGRTKQAQNAIAYEGDFKRLTAQGKEPKFGSPDVNAQDRGGFVGLQHAKDTLELIESYTKFREAAYKV